MSNLIIEISQQEFDSMRLMNNNVAVKITHRNAEEQTKSGIIIVQDPAMLTAHSVETAEMHDSSQHLDRWGIVAKLPAKLKYAKHNKMAGMDWDTDIEIQVGDMVWSDYYNLHHCPIFQVEEKQYWIITYDCLIVAKRPYRLAGFGDDDIVSYTTIPLNGFCLFNQINEGLTSKFLILDEKINKTKGITRFVGSRNKEYTQQWNNGYGRFIPSKKYDDIDIKPGDEVLFRTEANCLLENAQHRYFADEDLRYEQRWNIIGIKQTNMEYTHGNPVLEKTSFNGTNGVAYKGVFGDTNKMSTYPLWIRSEKFNKLLVIQNTPERKIFLKNTEITEEELINYLEQIKIK